MIYIYAQREACQDRLVATKNELHHVVPFLNLLDQYGHWPEGYEVVVFSPDEGEDNQGIVYHFTGTLEMLGKMPEVFFDITTSCGPASNAQEWWG